jgi:serralysin
MSYWDASNTGADHIRDGTHYVGATPLLYDILALQKLYGANMATRTGDTVYGFNSNTGQSPFNFAVNPGPVIAIWDAGGNDTLDLSGYATPSRIDLNDGEFSDAGGMTMNIAIAFGAVIENAVGGAGDDVLIGNSANNVLTGGGGSDRLSGARGVDVLIGSAGADVFVFNATADSGIKALLACGPDKSIKNVVPDLLRDFVSGEDRIDLSIIDAVASSEGDDAFTYIGSAAFSGRAGELRFEFANGTVHIFGDVDGNGIADLHIITSGSTLQPGDFIL